ncbi:MAG: histone family protein [Firmicutes bacterium]|nr:histone family protein [Bacillota bacterium]
MDISTISVSELKALLEKIPAEIKRREKAEKLRIRKELEELAAKSGYSLQELLGEDTEKVTMAKKAVAIKFRHPQDATLTWTGRGRRPKWAEAFLAAGGTMEQLAV